MGDACRFLRYLLLHQVQVNGGYGSRGGLGDAGGLGLVVRSVLPMVKQDDGKPPARG